MSLDCNCRFSLQFQVEDNLSTLSVIQQSEFMTFPLLTLPFRAATELEMNSYLIHLIQEFQHGVRISIVNHMQDKPTVNQFQKLHDQYSNDISNLQQQHAESLSSLQITYESQIASLNQQITSLEEQHTSTLQANQSQWAEQLSALQNQLSDAKKEL